MTKHKNCVLVKSATYMVLKKECKLTFCSDFLYCLEYSP